MHARSTQFKPIEKITLNQVTFFLSIKQQNHRTKFKVLFLNKYDFNTRIFILGVLIVLCLFGHIYKYFIYKIYWKEVSIPQHIKLQLLNN